jgi:hypothetical protein
MRKQDETTPAAAWSLSKDGEPYKLMYERDERGPSYAWSPLYDQAALDAERDFRRAVQEITRLLQDGEWAEHASSDPDIQALEAEVSRLLPGPNVEVSGPEGGLPPKGRARP